jgi:hypothetical protein
MRNLMKWEVWKEKSFLVNKARLSGKLDAALDKSGPA